MTGKARDEYLLDNVDALAAMGMSAWDGSRLGVPTILLNFSYRPIPTSKDYRFKWIFESVEIGGGDFLKNSDFEQGNRSLEDVIGSIRREYHTISEKTFRYCIRHHAITSVGDRFLESAGNASFRYGDIRPSLLKKGLARKMYAFLKDRLVG